MLCTNTMHKVAAEIEARAGIPILHIADCTGRRVVEAGFQRVGLLATRYTMEQDFYKQRLKGNFSLDVLVPSKSQRNIIHHIIYKELVCGIVRNESRDAYVEIVHSLVERGAHCIILGCTEINMLIDESDSPVATFDTTGLHCEGAVEWALAALDM